MKKLFSFILTICFMMPFMASCNNGDVIENSEFLDEGGVTVTFGAFDMEISQINSSPIENNVVVYNREYKLGGKYSMTIGEAQQGRIGLSVRCIEKNGKVEFDIVERNEEASLTSIPVNGFALSVPAAMLDGVRANVGQLLKVDGYEKIISSYERHDLATLTPDYLSSTATRRINYVNPVDALENDKIYYVDDNFKGTLTLDSPNKVVKVKSSTNYSSTIISVETKSEIAAPEKDTAYFVFLGQYNVDYAEHYMTKAERVSYSMLDKANAYTDVPGVLTKSGIIKFNSDVYNVEDIGKSGIYVYDNSFSAAVTPASDIVRKDVVVVNGYVALLGDDNARTLIPDGNGFVISLVGEEYLSREDELKIGTRLETYYIDYRVLPEKYVEINNVFYEVSHIDGVRSPEGVAVLYTNMFGKSTQTNEYGSEIVIVDGKVSDVKLYSGNSEIPENAYVLSVHKDHPSYSEIKNIQVGDAVEISLSGSDYSVTELKFDGINTTRFEDTLIIYRNKVSSGANEFGYEIAVDADGYAVADGYSGNITIPKGGFALSGHGVNKTALENVYAVGERVIVDDKSKTVTIIKTPVQKIQTAKANFAIASDKLQSAKRAFMNLDYTNLDAQFELLSTLLADAEKSFAEYDFEKAILTAESVTATCEGLAYAMIESKGVENRAVWHRSFEKSDAEVRATVEKMRLLNVNAVYLETWYEGYCIGAKVDVDGIATPSANAGYDALDGFVRICHEYGIEVHAWVHNFFVGFYYDNGTDYYNPYFKQYKDKYLLDVKGRDYFYYSANNNKFIFLNSNDRECRDLILEIYEQLITKYDIDGLHLDYIRYPELNYGTDDYGYNQDIIDAFAKKTGIKDDPHTFVKGSSNEKAWIQFRCDIITDWMREVYELVREKNPNIWLSAATYPDITLSKNTIAQDVKTFVEKGYLDEVFSMSYGIDTATVLTSVKDYVRVTNGNVFYSAGIAAFLETTPNNFAEQLAAVEQNGADGVSVFSLGAINPEKYQTQITNGAFKNPSVQVYKLSETVSAQMDYIKNKADNLSAILEELDAEDLSFIREKCDEIKSKAEAFELENAMISEKIKYCSSAIFDIESAVAQIIDKCGESKETNAFIFEFNDLVYWLSITEARLNTRK